MWSVDRAACTEFARWSHQSVKQSQDSLQKIWRDMILKSNLNLSQLSPNTETSTWGVRFLSTSQLVLPELLSPQLEPVKNDHFKSLYLISSVLTINIKKMQVKECKTVWLTRVESGFRATPACHSQRAVVPRWGLFLACKARRGPGRSRDTFWGERNLPQLMSQRGVGNCTRRPFGVTVSGYSKKSNSSQWSTSHMVCYKSCFKMLCQITSSPKFIQGNKNFSVVSPKELFFNRWTQSVNINVYTFTFLSIPYWPEVLCAVLLRELLWLEARMDVQALFEGSVVLSDEDGPEITKSLYSIVRNINAYT